MKNLFVLSVTLLLSMNILTGCSNTATQSEYMDFMGISMDLDSAAFKRELKAKGYEERFIPGVFSQRYDDPNPSGRNIKVSWSEQADTVKGVIVNIYANSTENYEQNVQSGISKFLSIRQEIIDEYQVLTFDMPLYNQSLPSLYLHLSRDVYMYDNKRCFVMHESKVGRVMLFLNSDLSIYMTIDNYKVK